MYNDTIYTNYLTVFLILIPVPNILPEYIHGYII